MIAFLDFEASSLGLRFVPVEVEWAIEGGTEKTHVILSKPGWDNWSADS